MWHEYSHAFEPDGNGWLLRIRGVGPDDWQRLVDFLRRTDAVLSYSVDGREADLPPAVATLTTDRNRSHSLAIRLDQVSLECPALLGADFSCRVDPAQIDSEAKARILFRFISTVGRTLGRPVILSREGAESQPIFRYEPGAGLQYLSAAAQ